MDKIPAAANAKVARYSLKYNEKDMTMTIHETDMSITIYVGNDSLYCIDAKILKKVNGELYEVGYLTKIGGCEDYIKVVLSYIHSNYPVGAVSFSDMSWAYGQINLAAFNYLTVRRVWFEDIYDGFASACVSASAADIVYEQKLFYRQLEFKLLDKKQKTPWEQLGAYIPVDKLSLPVEEVRELYMKAATWQDFFRPIVERLGEKEKEKVYMIFSPWFHAFVTGYLGISYISLQYILPVKDYGVYTVKEDNPKSTEASGSLQA
jgi:hypothetical protein